MKYFLIAGEPSGDQHAGRLMKALAARDREAEFRFLGGDQMSETGGVPLVHIREMAFMGFTQVLANLGKINRNFKLAKRAIMEFRPDVIIFVDYPGFNMRMAAWARKRGFKTHYYIAPSVWAWNTRRVYQLKRNCDRIFTILPFEKDFLKSFNVDADYVGNPVFESVTIYRENLPVPSPSPVRQIALLPGSRRQEIEKMLPVMITAAARFPDYEFVIAGMESHRELYKSIVGGGRNLRIVYDKPLEVLNGSVAALVTSGTATLETALMGIPQLVCYKTNTLSYLIAKSLVKVQYISLVNLILDRPAIPELIQSGCNATIISESLTKILPEGPQHRDQVEIAASVRAKLGDPQVSKGLARLIVSDLSPLG